MIELNNTSVMNFENALRGMRNPLSSWQKSDSRYDESGQYVIGEQDLALAKRLRMAGSDHRKYLRQIFVSVDINAPLYWWKEYDTYKVATVANSTSTMHKLHAQAFRLEDFSHDRLSEKSLQQLQSLVDYLEELRQEFCETRDKEVWYNMIQLLPSSYRQLRTCSMNYETLIGLYFSRKNHKLAEWHVFCDWVASLPYARTLILGE